MSQPPAYRGQPAYAGSNAGRGGYSGGRNGGNTTVVVNGGQGRPSGGGGFTSGQLST